MKGPDMIPLERSQSEQEFINQKARELLVGWADEAVRGLTPHPTSDNSVYFEFARSKGWISKTDGRVLSSGFDTAARFLKR